MGLKRYFCLACTEEFDIDLLDGDEGAMPEHRAREMFSKPPPSHQLH